MHGPTIMRGSCMAQAAPMRTEVRGTSFLKPVKGTSSPSRTEVIIDQSQQLYDDITSSYIMAPRWSAVDRPTARGSQRSTSGKCRTSMVYHGGWTPSYMWSYLDFNASEESLVTGDVQEDSLYMKPASSDSVSGSSCDSGTVSDSGSPSEAVPPAKESLHFRIQHGSEAGQIGIRQETLQSSVSCSINMITAEEARGKLIIDGQPKTPEHVRDYMKGMASQAAASGKYFDNMKPPDFSGELKDFEAWSQRFEWFIGLKSAIFQCALRDWQDLTICLLYTSPSPRD